MSVLTSDSRIRPNADLLSTEVDGEVVMMSVKHGVYYGLDPIASDVWRRLARSPTLGDLTRGLVEAYEGDPAVIESDVRALLETMREKDMIQVDG
ncbi:MAG: PqqD family protein [Alphaproteobacteria bacterium]